MNTPQKRIDPQIKELLEAENRESLTRSAISIAGGLFLTGLCSGKAMSGSMEPREALGVGCLSMLCSAAYAAGTILQQATLNRIAWREALEGKLTLEHFHKPGYRTALPENPFGYVAERTTRVRQALGAMIDDALEVPDALTQLFAKK